MGASSGETERLVAEILRRVPGVIAIYRFGSASRQEQRERSDLDLAVLAAGALPAKERWSLQEDLAALAGRDVDLVDLRSASTVMRMQVLARGDLLHEGDRPARWLFEMLAYSDYARLNEERREILDRIGREGRVHAG